MSSKIDPVFQLSPRITLLPVVHGSGDFAAAVRRVMLELDYDCLAVPLPESFQSDVERAIQDLPTPTVVVQGARWGGMDSAEFHAEDEYAEDDSGVDEFDDDGYFDDGSEDSDSAHRVTYVPIDPCQPIIAALRTAMGERRPRIFIDPESKTYVPNTGYMPDPYALRKVALQRFSAAILPAIQRPEDPAIEARLQYCAGRLRQLESQYGSILFICSMLDWPWIRDAYLASSSAVEEYQESIEAVETYAVEESTLAFLFGEIPWITGLYEQARAELEDDENLSVDGVKNLLLATRQRYLEDFRHRARPITPHALGVCLKYMRNLSLMDRRLTPDLYTMVVVAQQVISDSFAIHLAEQSRVYPWSGNPRDLPVASLGIHRLRVGDDVYAATNRLPGIPMVWRSLSLRRRPDRDQMRTWQTQWNPFQQCSWPPEDHHIENLRERVVDRAKQILSSNLARHEKFTTSVKDGIDLRETLRNWHTGELYVKEYPPDRGMLDAVVMLFDSPADPRNYPWRTTWFAEHEEESTLAFFATDFRREMIGPGIGVGTYGGAMFLFPPRPIPDVWEDPSLDFTETLEERLLAAACLHSHSPHIALVSALPPGIGWRRLAKHLKRKWVHVPLSSFGASTIEQLRTVHVLNGKDVRSYAAQFIRRG